MHHFVLRIKSVKCCNNTPALQKTFTISQENLTHALKQTTLQTNTSKVSVIIIKIIHINKINKWHMQQKNQPLQ